MLNHRQYLLGILIVFAIATLTCIVFDPYGFYGIVVIKGVNQQKEGVRNKIRYVKAIQIAQREPQTILMGSSRVQDGINPENSSLQQYPPVYNYGINMIRIYEAREYLKHAIVNSKIKRVVLGLDFFMFNELERVNPSFDSTLVGRKVNILDLVTPALPSKTTIGDIYSTINISHMQDQREEFLINGYRPGQYTFYKVIDYKKLHYYTNWIFLSDNKMGSIYYARYKTGQTSFDIFEDFLNICKQNKIECQIFLTPAHALLDGEGIRLCGLWNDLENYKRKITALAEKYNDPLWDFSGYNNVTTEKVKTPMKYYWDSSHFSEYTSNLILSQMFNKDPGNKEYFGTLLTNANIEAHLQKIRNDREEYIRSNKEDVKWLNDMWALIQAHKPIPSEIVTGIFAK